jgi:acetolactate synthase-1/2/3 large subunit
VLEESIIYSLNYPGPVVCEVICENWQEIVPTLMGKKNEDGTITAKPLEDMYPFLLREEFYDKMIVDPIE